MNERSVSIEVLWYAFKAYIRGVIISAKANRDKEHTSTREALIKLLENLDKLHKMMQEIKYHEEYQQVLKLLDVVDAKSIVKGLMYGRQNYCEYREKPGRMLARVLAEHPDRGRLERL